MPVDIIKKLSLSELDERAGHRHEFYLWPKRWQSYPKDKAYEWIMVQLVGEQHPSIPDVPGIYTLLIQPRIAGHPACSFLMYVGRAKSLNKRFGNYLGPEKRATGRPKIFELLNRYPDNVWFCYTQVSSKEEYEEWDLYEIELALWEAYIPPKNDMRPARPKAPRRALFVGETK